MCLPPPGRDGRGHQPGRVLPHSTCTPCSLCPCALVGGLTEALLEPDSSSALGGCVAFFRLRGLDRAAFRRLLGGLVEESSYSSAREKRSLNLREWRTSCRSGGLIPQVPPILFSAPCPGLSPTPWACWSLSLCLEQAPPLGFLHHFPRPRSLTSSCGLRHSSPGRAAEPGELGSG